MKAPTKITVEEWLPDTSEEESHAASVEAEIETLAEILHAVVHAGAGVSFFLPFSLAEARTFWGEKVLPAVRAGTRRVLVARLDDSTVWGEGREPIVGTVQLDLDMPPNQQHRVAVTKLLVHPTARRRGVGRALMLALEQTARSAGRTLLTLDTVTSSNAEFLYTSLGYITVGVIPRYARGSLTPVLESTTVMYKELPPAKQ